MVWSAGAILTAAQLNTYAPQTWTAWAPVLTGTTNPVIGNGTAVGRYIQFGKLAIVTAKITFGSTSTYGSGQWSLSLPVAIASAGGSVARASCLYTNTGSAFYSGTSTTAGVSSIALGVDVATAGGAIQGVTPTAPFTWGSTDVLEVSVVYEAP